MITLTHVNSINALAYKDFLIDSFNNCYAINDYKDEVNTLDEFWNVLREKEVFIVNKNNKNVGFFTQDIDHHSKAVGATIFIHPRSCPMAIISCLKIATLRGLRYIVDNAYDYAEFDTWAVFIANEVKKLIPNLQIHIIRQEWIICNSKTDIELYLKVLSEYNITDINTISLVY